MTLVAIDGPSGAGKSTVARGVARGLGLDVLDTGAMYRAVTLAVLDGAVDPGDEGACADLARAATIEVGDRVVLDGRDVTEAIRSPQVTATVSAVSAHRAVRAVLVQRQRDWAAERGGGVVEGRDIGTVVFPDATVKVFLTASDEERARRRQLDEAAAAREVDVARVREELDRRDQLDSSRATSPLQAAPDAVLVDTTGRDAATIVDDILAAVAAADAGAA
jgi:cytidylate kinase